VHLLFDKLIELSAFQTKVRADTELNSEVFGAGQFSSGKNIFAV
jgi:hypothetical protein